MSTQWPPGTTPSSYFANSGSRATSKGTQVNFRVEPQLLAELATVGNDLGVSLSETCRLLLREALDNRQPKAKRKGK